MPSDQWRRENAYTSPGVFTKKGDYFSGARELREPLTTGDLHSYYFRRSLIPPKGGLGFLMSPLLTPVWNLRAFGLIPLLYISFFVLLPSPVPLSALSFSAFGPFRLLNYFSLNLHFPKGRLFCVALVWLF